ncbi:MAG: HAD family hydrolase [Candidatus Abyssobacteria bacterium SURF_17]|uniref:HAD family hydrolase n=1 Tax=Candidatus Abyssobacteria bacterium SURF_17 TaxID=2093361 RepID=A0A419F624_9BACT|nr:MAG: HAD family hydrolase [Candidatus Abyssubacteria bacterium SURF_17]
MSARKYDYVFLDAGYTLFTANPSPARFYHQVCTRHGAEFTLERLTGAMREVWVEHVIPEMTDPEADLVCSDEEDRMWWWNYDREVFKRLGILEEKQEGIFAEIYRFFSDPAAWELYPDTLESLEQLRASNLSLAIVSNWNSSLGKIVDGLKLADYFDFVISSAEAGWKKPSPRIFELALERAGADAPRVVHIGDTYQTDVLGARKAGIRGIMLDRRGGTHHDHEVITCLTQLHSLLAHG